MTMGFWLRRVFILWFVYSKFGFAVCSWCVVVLKAEFSSVTVGSILDKAVCKRLKVCPYFKRVSFGCIDDFGEFRYWNMCCLDHEHCAFRGRLLKFDTCCHWGFLRVVWVCPKVVGLPFGGDVYG